MSSNSSQNSLFLGIDLGGTNVKAGVVDASGKALSHVSVETQAQLGPETGLANIEKAGRLALAEAGISSDSLRAVGLGSPGTMDLETGYLLDPPNLPGWTNFPIRDLLAARLGRPTVLQNDANAAAFGEYWVGAGAGDLVRSMVLFTLGTGVGGGVIDHGRIIQGRHSAGSECGHVIIDYHESARMCPCGHRGHLEAYASATSLVKRAVEGLASGESSVLSKTHEAFKLTARAIAEAARAGDSFASRLMEETAFYLAVGAVSVMNVIDPDMIVFGGGMIAAGTPFLERIRFHVKRLAFPVPGEKCRVEFASLGNDAGFIGAAGWAKAVFDALDRGETIARYSRP
jgi:glucokinase